MELRDAGAGSSMQIPVKAQLFVHGVAVLGASLLVVGLVQWSSLDPIRFAVCLAVAALASVCKVRLPGMVGTISISFVVILFAASELEWGEMMAMAALAGAVQSYWRAGRRPRPTQVFFNMAALVLSSAAAYAACHSAAALFPSHATLLASLLVSTAVYYGFDTALVGAVLGLIEQELLINLDQLPLLDFTVLFGGHGRKWCDGGGQPDDKLLCGLPRSDGHGTSVPGVPGSHQRSPPLPVCRGTMRVWHGNIDACAKRHERSSLSGRSDG